VLEEDAFGRTAQNHVFLDRLFDVDTYSDRVVSAHRDLKMYQKHMFLMSFTSVQQYLYLLYHIVALLTRFQSRTIILSAAAVSDFYIPRRHLSEHKISSSRETLTLTLHTVPKLLALLKSAYPHFCFVTFKLETDESLLLRKARLAIATVGHELVIGNILETRHEQIYVIREASYHIIPEDASFVSPNKLETQLADILVNYHQTKINHTPI
jgi:phosphopantothenate---cysteine ligase (ATP)